MVDAHLSYRSFCVYGLLMSPISNELVKCHVLDFVVLRVNRFNTSVLSGFVFIVYEVLHRLVSPRRQRSRQRL